MKIQQNLIFILSGGWGANTLQAINAIAHRWYPSLVQFALEEENSNDKTSVIRGHISLIETDTQRRQ